MQPREGDVRDVFLLQGCCLEADRYDYVSGLLQGLCCALIQVGRYPLRVVIHELEASSRVLRELTDLSQIHQDRVPLILDSLNIVLCCLSRFLRDMTTYLCDGTRPRASRWRAMCRGMADEAGGLPLSRRFWAYNQYLTSVRDFWIW